MTGGDGREEDYDEVMGAGWGKPGKERAGGGWRNEEGNWW